MEQTPTGRERLALWLDRSHLNQLEGARIIGIDHTQLNQILSGRRRPGLDNAVRIQKATGIGVEAWVPLGDDEIDQPKATHSRKALVGKA